MQHQMKSSSATQHARLKTARFGKHLAPRSVRHDHRRLLEWRVSEGRRHGSDSREPATPREALVRRRCFSGERPGGTVGAPLLVSNSFDERAHRVGRNRPRQLETKPFAISAFVRCPVRAYSGSLNEIVGAIGFAPLQAGSRPAPDSVRDVGERGDVRGTWRPAME